MTGTAVAVGHEKCGRPKRQGGDPCGRPAGWGTDHVGSGPCKLHGGNTPVRHGRYSTMKREELRALIEQHEADPDPLNVLPELAAARALFQDFIERYDEWREAVLAWHASYSPAMRPASPEVVQALQDVIDELESYIGPVPDEPDVRMDAEPQGRGGWLERHRAQEPDDEESRIHTSVRIARALIESIQTAPDLKPREILDLSDAVRHLDVISKMVERVEKIRAAAAVTQKDLFRIMGEMGRVVERYVSDHTAREKIKDAWLSIRL